MAKNLRKFLAFAVAVGAAAGTYYYFRNKKDENKESGDSKPDPSLEEEETSFEDLEFDDGEFDDDDFEDESEPSKTNGSPVFSKGTNEQGHTYVTLDLKAAQEKAALLRDNVVSKVGETVTKIKSSSEYETVSGKISETVDKFRSSEELHEVNEHLENTIHKVKEATECAAELLNEKISENHSPEYVTLTPEPASDPAKAVADTVETASGAVADAVEDTMNAVTDSLDKTESSGQQ